MSAAATAAGYLYASGRLRGRSAREQDHHNEQRPEEKEKEKKTAPAREEIRVAVLPQQDEKPRRTPKIEYRRRRWSAA